jgi:hypothetical protein
MKEQYLFKYWYVEPGGPIPTDGIRVGDILWSEQPDKSALARKLSWRDGACFMSLPFDTQHPAVEVDFGNGTIPCYVDLEVLDDGSLKGTLTPKPPDDGGVGDGNTGTFIAEAHPGVDGSS